MKLDYSRFRFRAVVDWLEVEITTGKPTNAQTVRRKGSLCYVTPVEVSAGGATTRFRFRLYDPDQWSDIAATLTKLEQEFPFSAPPMVSGIEVSFDAYANGASTDELAELTANFYKFNSMPVSTNRRIAGRWKGDTEGIAGHKHTVRKTDEGRVIAIGNKSDPISQRIYFKTVDNNGQALPDEQHRARIEVTLQGDAVPLTALEDWHDFKFTTLAGYFKFRQLKDQLDPYARTGAECLDQIGERRKRSRKGGGTRLYAKVTQADTALNRKAYDALRELSRRMGKPQQ